MSQATYIGWACSLSSLEMDKMTQVQILDEAICNSNSADTLGNDIHPILLPPAVRR